MEKGSNTEKTLGFIDRNKKAIITSSFVLLGVILIYKAYKRFSITIDDKIDDEIEETGEGLIKSQMTITEEQANNVAQILLDAMNESPCFICYGTDEKAILEVFKKLKNKHDFLAVYKAFGKKDYNGFNSPSKSLIRTLDHFKPRNLVYWLRSELSPLDGAVYKIVKHRVESAGFTF